MKSSPKILVFRLREVIYTILLVFLAAILLLCLVLMFTGKSENRQAKLRSDHETTVSEAGDTLADADTGSPAADADTGNTAAGSNAGIPTADADAGNTAAGSNAGIPTADASAGNTAAGSNAGIPAADADAGNTAADAADAGAGNTAATDGSSTTASADAGTPVSGPAGAASGKLYTAGVYTSRILLGDSAVDIAVTVDPDHINDIRLVDFSETDKEAWPLVTMALESLTSQILEKQSLDGITCSTENRHTSQLLFDAIVEALKLAQQSY